MSKEINVPYTKPTRLPDYKFVNKEIMVEVFVNEMNVEVFQHSSTTQRFVLSRAEYSSFQSRLLENGFNRI